MLGGNSPIAMVAAIVPALGPMVAAIITVKITGRSVQAWIRSLGPVRGGGRWCLAAALLVVALVAIATGAYVVAGGQFTVPAVTVSALLSAFVLTTTLGGGLEELGWRGYLLPRLQERWTPVGATIIVGLGWAIWHLPLFVLPGAPNAGQPFWGFGAFTASVVAMSFAFTWLYNMANGSVLPVIFLHGLQNTANLVYPFAPDTSVALNYGVGLVGYIALAALLLLVTRGQLAGERGPVRSFTDSQPAPQSEPSVIAD